MSIFKQCDVRGTYGEDLTEEFAFRLGQAIAALFDRPHVALGGDYRISTPTLKRALCRGLLQSGANVTDLGTLPTPAFYFGRSLLDLPMGVMVTASHNPPQYNGFKITIGDLPLADRALQELERRMRDGPFVQGQGSLHHRNVLDDYVLSVIDDLKLTRRRVIVDAGNGTMGPTAPKALRQLDQDVIELFCEPDGRFPSRDPNPSIPEHLNALSQRVVESEAALGVAYDGDGDRVIFVDEHGDVQPADGIFVLFVRRALADNPGARVIYDQKCSSAVPTEIRKLGGIALMERSGHAFIKQRMLAEGACLAGEASGHYFFGELRRDDALYATIYLLHILDGLNTSLAEAMATVPRYPITPDIRIPCSREKAQIILRQLIGAFPPRQVQLLDGVRIQFEDGWALVRESVTEPKITLRFEGVTQKALERVQSEVRKASPELDHIMAS